MSRTNVQIAGMIVGHVSDILGGSCSITREEIDAATEDPGVSDMLSGLLFLHEDLEHREAERQRAESELRAAVARLEAQNEELEKSRSAFAALAAELSAPVIRVWDKVLMMPLIGHIDRARAADMMDRLLAGVAREKAHHVIVDLTGVAALDADSADAFVRILRAVRLLGAQGIAAGIPPEVARALVSLGVDISDIRTVPTVQSALRHCMREMARGD